MSKTAKNRTVAAAATDEAATDEDDTSTTSSGTKAGNYCSLCWDGDSDEMRLWKCRVCRVLYHNECYRGVSTGAKELEGVTFEEDEDDEDLLLDTCLACAAVGSTVKGRTKDGDPYTLKVGKRPYECCLCSVDNPSLPLAMHPIYDRNNGRQLVLEGGGGAGAPKHRLAWCHTLCARAINAYADTGGCVYSCDRKGYYEGHVGDDDDRSVSSEIQQARDEDDERRMTNEKDNNNNKRSDVISFYGVHHFCIVITKNWPQFTKAITKHQKFRCIVCGKNDKPKNIFRIPIPCMCKEIQEPKAFTRCHTKRDDECLQGMHVGCAMWGSLLNGKQQFPNARRVYFEPSDLSDSSTDLCLIYCNNHAKNIQKRGKDNGIIDCNWSRYPRVSSSGAAIATTAATTPVVPTLKMDFCTNESESEDDDEEDDDECVETCKKGTRRKKKKGTIESESEDDEEEEEEGGVETCKETRLKKRKKKKGTIDSESEEEEEGGVKTCKETRRKKKKGKDRKSKKRKNATHAQHHHKEETSKDRLERIISKKRKTSSAAENIRHSTAATANNNKQPGFVMPVSFNDKTAATSATTTTTTAGDPQVKQPPKKKRRKRAPLRLRGLLDGTGVNWDQEANNSTAPNNHKKNHTTKQAAAAAVGISPDSATNAVVHVPLKTRAPSPEYAVANPPSQPLPPPTTTTAPSQEDANTSSNQALHLKQENNATINGSKETIQPAPPSRSVVKVTIDWSSDSSDDDEDLFPSGDQDYGQIMENDNSGEIMENDNSCPPPTTKAEDEPDENVVETNSGAKEEPAPENAPFMTTEGELDAVSEEGKRKHDKFLAQIMGEIDIKRTYRSEGNQLDAILDEVKSHWKDELSRCGFQNVGAFFQTVWQKTMDEYGQQSDDPTLL